MDSIMTFGMFDIEVKCAESEYALFNIPGGQTCATYLEDYMSSTGEGSRTYLQNPEATSGCKVCQYRLGSDYLATLNINDYYFGWRDAGIVVIFALSSYAFVFLLMKLRTKASKKAE
jgi:ATP-binding cassette subfamily G (WHITE) protein 2 (SNQ2)